MRRAAVVALIAAAVVVGFVLVMEVIDPDVLIVFLVLFIPTTLAVATAFVTHRLLRKRLSPHR
jgi:hypothetical protein